MTSRGAAAACIASGLALAAALPPMGFWPLAVAGLVLLDGAIADRPAWSRFRRGALAGAALYLPTLAWMAALTVPGYLVAVALFSAMTGTAMALCPPCAPARWLALPGAFVLLEAVRERWPLGGVPLSLLSHSQVAGPLGPTARLAGGLLLTGLSVVAALVLAAAARRRWRAAGVAAAVVVGVVALAAVAPRGQATGTLDVALVQGGGPQGTRASETDPRVVFERHLAASAEIGGPVDLVLWPEDVVDVEGPLAANPEGAELAALARRLDTTLVVGVVEGAGDDRFRNAAVALAPDGDVVDRFDKVRRVPFGEFVPWRSVLEPVAGDALVPRDAIAGTDPAVVDTPLGRFGVVISWEVFFSDRARDAIGNGGQVLLNPTNGASFRGIQVQAQQIAASRLRSLATGRWTLQAAPTGFSAIITSDGEVVARSGVSERAVVTGTVETRTGQTLATRLGNWPAAGLAVLGLAAGWGVQRRRTRNVNDGRATTQSASSPPVAVDGEVGTDVGTASTSS